MYKYFENKSLDDLPNEEWKQWKNLYYASSLGRIKFIGGYLRWRK